MGCITLFLLLCNIAVIVGIDVLLWTHSATMGLIGLGGLGAFLIGYALSVEISIAPRDFWWNSEFGIFIKKLTFANSAALFVLGISIFIAYSCDNESVIEFINWIYN
ncbi:putative membrane protein YkgB [Dysgonomonadaceae bacterium PH5-43]|nr:putative membrane protein YkgB [Dysgonomonadaceae bacterium PH5-43]